MPLLRLNRVSLAFGHRPLLDEVELEMFRGERVCLLGRNGEGKSSLLRLIGGETMADDGDVWLRPGMRIASLAQEIDVDVSGIVFDVVAGGLPELGSLVSEYHHVTLELEQSSSPDALQRLSVLQHELEARGGWQIQQRVASVLSRFQLDGDMEFEALSGGWRRRVMLARALVCEPDVLLLDEPTNHLDLEMRHALSMALVEYSGALLVISHDRHLLRSVCDELYVVNDGQLIEFKQSIDDYAGWLKSQDIESNEQQTATQKNTRPSSKKQNRQTEAKRRQQLKPFSDKVRKIEMKMNQQRASLKQVEANLQDASLYSDDSRKEEMTSLMQAQAEFKTALESLEWEWLEASEALEKAEMMV
ncbi:MAG: ABC-F family ATP-binding cassette domain-containing protein [Gammaproteobacteria bacterium]|nr:ABC-F family ATP-binding cassette domain-containing protein [Gammaproteobacteria bacterium]